MKCLHISCGTKEKVWLPFESQGLQHGYRPHPYCIHCGSIKNISSDKIRNIGYYINVLSKLAKQSNEIKEVQKRLIIIELSNLDYFEDSYLTRDSQEIIFIKIVKKYSSISENQIYSILK